MGELIQTPERPGGARLDSGGGRAARPNGSCPPRSPAWRSCSLPRPSTSSADDSKKKRNFLAYAPAQPQDERENNQLIAFLGTFESGPGVLSIAGRNYRYAWVEKLPCFQTGSLTPAAARRGARRRARRGWFLGALAAGAVLALVGFHPGARTDGIPRLPAASGGLHPAALAQRRDYRRMAGTRDLADRLPGCAGDHRSGLLPSGGAGRRRSVYDRPGAPGAGAASARTRSRHLDVILITHAHMDHLDLPSLRTLPKDRDGGELSGMPRSDRAAGLHRCPPAVVGREHHRARAQDHRDGRAAIGAADGPGRRTAATTAT